MRVISNLGVTTGVYLHMEKRIKVLEHEVEYELHIWDGISDTHSISRIKEEIENLQFEINSLKYNMNSNCAKSAVLA
jgi:hypothetical protein